MIDEKKLIQELTGVEVAWYMDGNYTTYDSTTVMDIIKEQPKVGEWIPCSVKLPSDDSDCLLCSKSGDYHIGYWRTDALSWDNSYSGWIYEDIVAWQPLPKLHEE